MKTSLFAELSAAPLTASTAVPVYVQLPVTQIGQPVQAGFEGLVGGGGPTEKPLVSPGLSVSRMAVAGAASQVYGPVSGRVNSPWPLCTTSSVAVTGEQLLRL